MRKRLPPITGDRAIELLRLWNDGFYWQKGNAFFEEILTEEEKAFFNACTPSKPFYLEHIQSQAYYAVIKDPNLTKQ